MDLLQELHQDVNISLEKCVEEESEGGHRVLWVALVICVVPGVLDAKTSQKYNTEIG